MTNAANDADLPAAGGTRVGAQATHEDGTTTVAVGIQLPPSAIQQLVEKKPDEMIALSRQIDEHQYQLAKDGRDQEHAFQMKMMELTHSNNELVRQHQLQVVKVVSLGLFGLIVVVLGAFSLVGDIAAAKEILIPIITMLVGAFGGYGFRGRSQTSE